MSLNTFQVLLLTIFLEIEFTNNEEIKRSGANVASESNKKLLGIYNKEETNASKLEVIMLKEKPKFYKNPMNVTY